MLKTLFKKYSKMRKTNIFTIFLILNVSLVNCYNRSEYHRNKSEESINLLTLPKISKLFRIKNLPH